jgi:sec-independent protein translocase protein TatB
MHFGDSIFIFLLALVLFGPKKLPEIGRTIGKLLAEFRRASNEFKFQIQEELRNMEDEERRKKLAEKQAEAAAKAAEAPPAADSSGTTPTILPPSIGAQVSTSAPYATPIEPESAPLSLSAVPSETAVIVEPAAPTDIAPASELPVTPELAPQFVPESPSHLDLTTPTNGAHPPATETVPVEPGLPSEPVQHG